MNKRSQEGSDENDEIEIFLSYSKEDKKLAHRIQKILERDHGFSTFLAHETIEVSHEWKAEIESHLRSCHALLPIVTKAFYESYWTHQEIGSIWYGNKPICTLWFKKDLEDLHSELPGVLKFKQALEVTQGNLEDRLSEISRFLKDYFRRMLSQERPASTAFSARWDRLRGIIEKATSNVTGPHYEVLVGPDRVYPGVLGPSKGDLEILEFMPDFLAGTELVGTREHYENRPSFENEDITSLGQYARTEQYLRIYCDGFIHYVGPIPQGSTPLTSRLGSLPVYVLDWIYSETIQLLFYAIRTMRHKQIGGVQRIRVALSGVGGKPVKLASSIDGLLLDPDVMSPAFAFSEDYSTLKYEYAFDPTSEWSEFYHTLDSIYRDLCVDLGILSMNEDVRKQRIKLVIMEIQYLRTRFSQAGMPAVPVKELIP